MVTYYPSFKAIVEGDVLATNNPFRYTYSENDGYFWDNDTLMLLDKDPEVPFLDRYSGDFQLIVKPDWEVMLRVKTENWGAFENGLGALEQRTLDKYGITIDDEFFSSLGWKSSFDVLLRGDAMFGVWIDGHERSEVWGKGSFDDEVRVRLSDPEIPNYGAAPNGMLMSLTHGDGNYDDRSTYTIRMEELDDETAIELLWIRRLDDVATRPVNTDSESIPKYDFDNITNIVTVASGTSEETGLSWSVKVGELKTPSGTTYWVFTNGQAIQFYLERSSAMQHAEREAVRAKNTADSPPIDTDPTPQNQIVQDIKDVTLTAGLSVGLILGAIIIILVLVRR